LLLLQRRPPTSALCPYTTLFRSTLIPALLQIARAPHSLQQRRSTGIKNSVLINAIVAVEVGDISRLTEVLHAQRLHLVPSHGSQPAEGRGVAIKDRYQPCIRRKRCEQPVRSEERRVGKEGSSRWARHA